MTVGRAVPVVCLPCSISRSCSALNTLELDSPWKGWLSCFRCLIGNNYWAIVENMEGSIRLNFKGGMADTKVEFYWIFEVWFFLIFFLRDIQKSYNRYPYMTIPSLLSPKYFWTKIKTTSVQGPSLSTNNSLLWFRFRFRFASCKGWAESGGPPWPSWRCRPPTLYPQSLREQKRLANFHPNSNKFRKKIICSLIYVW